MDKVTKEIPELTHEQITAIRRHIRLSSLLISAIPQIEEDYRSGLSANEIVDKYDIMRNYCASKEVARHAVLRALKYFIPEDESLTLALEHKKNAGEKSFKNNRGIHGLTFEERSKIGRAAGEIGGRSSAERKRGYCGLTLQQRIEAGKRGMLARGELPWSEDETNCFRLLCENPSYQYVSGLHKGRPNYYAISHFMQEKFGIKRSPLGLRSRKYRYSKDKN